MEVRFVVFLYRLLRIFVLAMPFCGSVAGFSGVSSSITMQPVTKAFRYNVPVWAESALTKSHPEAGRLILGTYYKPP